MGLHGVRLLCRLRLNESIEPHARLVDPHHDGIRLEVAVVEHCIEHLRHEAAIGHRDLIAKTVFPMLPVLSEERLQHPETLDDPVAVPDIHAFVVQLVGATDIFPRAQVVERMDLASDDLR